MVRAGTAICALAVLAAPAAASPNSDPTAGRAVFTGATTPSPTSIVLDPAALAVARTELAFFAYATGTLDQLKIDRKTLDVATGALSSGPRIHAHTASPGVDFGVLWHPSEKLAFGIEGRTPPAQQFLGGQDALRYYTLGGTQREYQASVAISVKATGSLLIGASITVDWTNLVLHFARDTALDNGHGPGGITSDCGGAPCGVENPAAAQRYDVDVWQHNPLGDGYIVNIGAMYEIARNTFVALAYHTPPGGETGVNNTLQGHATVDQAPRDGVRVLRGGSTIYVSEPVTLDAELRTRLPGALDLHVGGRWEDLSRNLGYDVRMYGSTFGEFDVPEWQERQRGFEDVLALWTGVEQVDTGQHWRFGGRIGLETAALPDDHTTPITISPTSGTLDLGAQVRLGTAVVQLSYGLQYFPTVHVDKSAFDPRQRIECVDSGYDYASDACQATRLGYALPSAAGDYGRIEHALRVGLRVELP